MLEEPRGYLMLGNANWRSLEDGKEYDISIKYDDEPAWLATAAAGKFPNSGPHYLWVNFKKPEFLKEFMKKNTVEVTYKSKEVAFLSLRGTYAAGAELLKCQSASSSKGTNTKARSKHDPFTKRSAHPFE